MERMRGMEPSFINEMLGERRGKRHVFGSLVRRGGSIISIDDYRIVGNGEFVQVVTSYIHEVITYPKEQLDRLVTDRRNLSGNEVTFSEGSNARPSK